jgi:ribonucleoside-diphosphate reductase alpha chain
MKFINDESRKTSEEIAKDRGVFSSWKGSIYDPQSKYYLGRTSYSRNSAITTIAPTGTIGIAAGLQGAGIEPFFAIAYVRYNAAGIDALKKGETPLEKDTFFEVNPLFKKIAQKHNFFGLEEMELYKKIEDNHKCLIGIPEIPEKIQRLFPTSHDITPLEHVRIQAAFQKYTDNAVSKTVNLKNEATVDDVREVYMLAYRLGCKGVTIYRDGCKQFQVLNIAKKEVAKTEEAPTQVQVHVDRVPTSSSYQLIQTGQGPLHVHINSDQMGPLQVFANLSPTGTEISGLTTALGIIISKYLEEGGNPNRLIKHLNSIKGDKPFGFGPKRVDSIPHGLSKALKDHLISLGRFEGMGGYMNGYANGHSNGHVLNGGSTQTILPNVKPTNIVQGPAHGEEKKQSMFCQKCYSSNVEMVSGCSEPTCFDCGYSKCS